MTRILMTGSREFSHPGTAVEALNASLALLGAKPASAAVLVHGSARGADTLLAQAAEHIGMRTEAHPAQWNQHDAACPASHHGNPTCKLAGHRRNAEMVSAGADVVLAFPTHGYHLAPGENPANTSRGTWNCAEKAKGAGLPTLVVWGNQLFPFGDAGLALLRHAAEKKGLKLGAAGEMPLMEAWLPF